MSIYLIENWATATDPISLDTGELHLWRIELDGPTENLVTLLAPDEQERADRLLAPQDRQRFIRVRGALRTILGQYLNSAPEALVFGYGEHGKPHLETLASDLHFNLTHSHELALLAIRRKAELGIDLERLRARPNLLAIAQRLFDPTIQQELSQLEGEALTQGFYRHWTAHEARLKAVGGGIFHTQELKGEPLEVTHFMPEEGWMAAVACSTKLPPVREWKHFMF